MQDALKEGFNACVFMWLKLQKTVARRKVYRFSLACYKKQRDILGHFVKNDRSKAS